MFNFSQTISEEIADFFKILGDNTRISILFVLMDGEKSVGEISRQVKMSSSAVSHQLRILRQSRFVGSRRDGKSVFYFLCDCHIREILTFSIEHSNERSLQK